MTQVCELVQRDAFTQSLQSLGLLDANTVTASSGECQKMTKSASFTAPKQHQHSYKVKSDFLPLAKNQTILLVELGGMSLRFSGSQRERVIETFPSTLERRGRDGYGV